MNDPKGGDGPTDRLAEKLKRAEQAVNKTMNTGPSISQPVQPRPAPKKPQDKSANPPKAASPDSGASFGDIDFGAGADDGELELGTKEGAVATGQTQAPSGAGFGEIDFDAGGGPGDLELDGAVGQKPKLKEPDLLKDEEYGDEGWAEGKKKPVKLHDPQYDDVEPAPAETPGQPPTQPTPGSPKAPSSISLDDPTKLRPPRDRAKRAPRPKAPRQPMSKGTKIAIVVVLCLGLIGVGVYFFLEWQKGIEAEEQAKLDALNSSSLDSLKNDAARKEQLGT